MAGVFFRGNTDLKTVLASIVLSLAAATVQAQCVQPGDIARGVIFTREAAGQGTAVQAGKHIQIDYEAGKRGKTNKQVATMGIYPVQGHVSDVPEGVIGIWFHGASTWTWQGNPPKPAAGRTWNVGLTVRSKGNDQSGDFKDTKRYKVTYQFEAPRQANLAGCTYTVVGVTARHVGNGEDFTNRYAYFPDLGFGLRTQYVDNATGRGTRYGITSMRPAG